MGDLDRLTIERVDVRAATLPTERPQTDGTFEWSSTTMVIVECRAAGLTGTGFTYASDAAAQLVQTLLAPVVCGVAALAVPSAHAGMRRAVRNQGRPGVAAAAISAVDVALWDLKARLLGVSLAGLLGRARAEVPAYASGGFTSSTVDELIGELAGYVAAGFRRVKMKVGRDPGRDAERVRAARDALGADVGLMVDGNGAYDRKQALAMARDFADCGVEWFEEPVSSDDLPGLRLLRDRGPDGMAIAAGEYGYDPIYFRRMLEAGAVDVLQADATRCLGVTGFLQADALCVAHGVPLSSHCAPSLHVHLDAAVTRLAHLEVFRDHARMEALLFEHAPGMSASALAPDPARPGLGLELRREEAARLAV